MTKRLFFVALVAIAVVGQSQSASMQGGTGQAEVLKAEQAFFDARTKGDSAVFTSLFIDEFTWGNTNGRFSTKEQMLASLARARPNPESGAETEVRMLGNDAALVVTGAFVDRPPTGDSTGPRKIVRLWTKRNGQWQIVSHQSYLVPPYPAN